MTPGRLLRIVRTVETCGGCPSQWDAWTDNGQYLFLRYRFGTGTVTTENDATGPARTIIARFQTGDPWDGMIALEDFCARAGLLLDLAAATDLDPGRLRATLLASQRGWFITRFPGMCEFCARHFEPGDLVRIEIPRGWRAACCAAGAG
jgi:hypothetical protein